jgi:trk system potassium uptake protein TrkA
MIVRVAGAGEVGYNISEKLSREKIDIVLIDKDSDRLRAVADALDVQTIESPIARPQVLVDAGIKNAVLFVAVTGSDSDNILACRYSQLLAPDVTRIARVRDSSIYN